MNSKFTRASLFFLLAGGFIAFAVLLVMMFAGNLGSTVQLPIWITALSLIFNAMLTIVIARFLWFQDEFFTLMTHFYPIVNRVMEVDNARMTGRSR